MTNDDLKAAIADLRGGIPGKCDFCQQPKPPEQLHPEEGGDWACSDCLERWRLSEVEEMRAALKLAGWFEYSAAAHVWKSPKGNYYRGPAKAYEIMRAGEQ